MFLPPLAMSDLSMGVVVSPLNCLMDEQVSIICTSLTMIVPVIKIMKLESVGVRAIRVTSRNASLVETVENGAYRFSKFIHS